MDRATAGNDGDSAVGKNKNAGLGRENEGRKRENAQLRSAKEVQDQKNAEQDRQIADLKRTNGALWKKTAEQDAKIADRDRENAALRRELAELKAVNTERDWKDKARDEKLAQLETVFDELRKERGDHSGPPKPSARIDNRAEGGGPSRDGERMRQAIRAVKAPDHPEHSRSRSARGTGLQPVNTARSSAVAGRPSPSPPASNMTI